MGGSVRRFFTTALVAALVLACGCASYRMPEPRDCAAIGAALGAVGGGAGGASYAKDHSTGGAVAIGLAATIAGGGIGYAVCALARRSPEPTPIPVQHTALPEPARPAAPAPPTAPVPAHVEVCSVSVVLDGVNFDSGKAEIRPDAARVLDQVVGSLGGCPAQRVRIEAHTDSVGSASYNETLSQRRANSVRSHLVGGGVSRERMDTAGFGERNAIADNATKEGRARNRRGEIHPIDSGEADGLSPAP